jgi:hypothetical protein
MTSAPEAKFAELDRQSPGQANHAPLGRGIGAAIAKVEAGDRGYVDDHTAFDCFRFGTANRMTSNMAARLTATTLFQSLGGESTTGSVVPRSRQHLVS